MDGNRTQIIYQAKCDLESLTLIRFMQHQEKPTRSRFWKDFFSSQDLSSVKSNRISASDGNSCRDDSTPEVRSELRSRSDGDKPYTRSVDTVEDSDADDYFNYNPELEKEQFNVSHTVHRQWNSDDTDTSAKSQLDSADKDGDTFPERPIHMHRQSTQRTHFDLSRNASMRSFRRMNSNRSARSGRSAHTFYSAKTIHRSLGDTETNELSRGELMRMNSVFSKQSIANVRLEDAAARLDMKSSLTIWIIIMTAAMTYTLHGFSNSITNGIITDGTFRHQFPQTDTVDTEGKQNSQNSTIQGIMVGLYQVGCAVGAFMCYFCSDRLGRKPVIHILGVTSCIGIILQCSAFNLPHLIIGRVVMGLGVGAGHATFPLYLAECVPSRIRGRAIIACAVGGNFGHFLGAIVEIAFYFVKKSPQWRIPLALELIWALSSATLPFWCPESPRYLLRKREVEKCITVQSKIFGLSENDPKVKEEVNAMEAALYEAGACDGNEDKKPARLWYRVFLGMFIQIMSSMSGIDVVSFFSTQTFQQQLHFSPLISRILTMGLQACQWLWSILSIFAIDSLGRRVLLLFCAALMATAMGCLFGLTIPSASAQMLKAALLFYFFTMCAYPVGYHLIPSMYVAEISPGNVRHEVAALSGCLHFLFDFLVTLITPIAFAAIGSRYYCVYLATNAVTFLVVYFLFIETKGVELETIEEIFEFSPSCLALVRFGNERATIAKELRVDCPPIPEDYPTDESSENQQT